MRLFILLTVYLIPFLSSGQTRTITGKVIYETDLTTLPGVIIRTDTTRLGVTDLNGGFKIEIPSTTNQLLFTFIGMEPTSIKIPNNCDNLEVIMMVDVIYDFVTIGTINRDRNKRFKNLKKLYRQAHDKGTFTSDKPCFNYIFDKYN